MTTNRFLCVTLAASPGTILHTSVTIGYDAPPFRVEASPPRKGQEIGPFDVD